MRTVDLRSDTVTRPNAAMREAMAHAEVGDDVLDHDPTVERLEQRVAEVLGKEAAMFVPSGTMANQICVREHCTPGGEIILDRNSHVVLYEAGAAAALSGVGFGMVDGKHGRLEPADVGRFLRPPVPHCPKSELVWVENTHNQAGGAIYPQDQLDAVLQAAKEAGLPTHLDGARLWNASVASGLSPARIVEHADSVSVCMSKGLGAPVGSLVAGTRAFIDACWVHRKRFGGGMRQSGILAAGALYGLEHHLADLADDHRRARALAERLNALPNVTVDLEAAQTNIVVFDVAGTGASPVDLAAAAEQHGLKVVPFGPTLLRAVTHYDASDEDVDFAGDVLTEVLAGKVAS